MSSEVAMTTGAASEAAEVPRDNFQGASDEPSCPLSTPVSEARHHIYFAECTVLPPALVIANGSKSQPPEDKEHNVGDGPQTPSTGAELTTTHEGVTTSESTDTTYLYSADSGVFFEDTSFSVCSDIYEYPSYDSATMSGAPSYAPATGDLPPLLDVSVYNGRDSAPTFDLKRIMQHVLDAEQQEFFQSNSDLALQADIITLAGRLYPGRTIVVQTVLCRTSGPLYWTAEDSLVVVRTAKLFDVSDPFNYDLLEGFPKKDNFKAFRSLKRALEEELDQGDAGALCPTSDPKDDCGKSSPIEVLNRDGSTRSEELDPAEAALVVEIRRLSRYLSSTPRLLLCQLSSGGRVACQAKVVKMAEGRLTETIMHGAITTSRKHALQLLLEQLHIREREELCDRCGGLL